MSISLAKGKCIIFSAPSGAGKTTIVHALLKRLPQLSFSISACSRDARESEIHGKDYYFMGIEGFKKKIQEEAFIEWEEVYPDHFYGTLKEEVERVWNEGKTVIFDVDVFGGINLKKYFGENALSFFIEPPSFEILEERLRKRQTETEDRIRVRLCKAKEEMQQKSKFDKIIVNNDLDIAIQEVESIVKAYLNL
ncbi:MAG: guanylate kinase [Brumimicrobium sp.]|nr:guanylate kinase [Brumimicrobium sp.]